MRLQIETSRKMYKTSYFSRLSLLTRLFLYYFHSTNSPSTSTSNKNVLYLVLSVTDCRNTLSTLTKPHEITKN